jgi:hypothetical protein
MEQDLECAGKWCTGHCPVRHPGALRTSHSREILGALRYNSPDYPVCHRSNDSLCTNGSLQKQQCSVPRQKSERRSQRAPDCPVQLEDKAPQRSTALNPNGCADVARTGQCTMTVRWRTGLSGAPIASRNQPTARSGWESINTPQPPHSLLSKPSEIFIHCKRKSPTLQDTIKAINPLKAPKSTIVH